MSSATDSGKRELPPKPPKPRSTSASNTVLQCQLCSSPYDTSGHEPKLLPCHHSFCLHCLNQLAHDRACFRCPDTSCRRKCAVPAGGVEQLQANFYINQLQSLVLPSRAVAPSRGGAAAASPAAADVCSKHLQQPLLFYCSTCSLPICMNCTVLDHDRNAGHTIMDMADVIENRRRALQGQMDVMRQALDSYQSTLSLLKTEMSNLEQTRRNTAEKMDATFDELMKTLTSRRDTLHQQAEETYKARRHAILEHAQTIKAQSTRLVALRDQVTQQYENAGVGGGVDELDRGEQAMHDVKQLCAAAHALPSLEPGYMRWQAEHGMEELQLAVRGVGQVRCDATLPSDIRIHATQLTAAIRGQVKVTASDVSGQTLSHYPISAALEQASPVPNKTILKPRCHDDGLYTFEFMPPMMGTCTFHLMFNEHVISGASQTLQVAANNPIQTFGASEGQPGSLSHPTSVSVSEAGDVYVADMGHKRIQVFDAGGAHKQSFAVGGSKSTTYDVTINAANKELLCSKVGPSESGVTVGNTIRVFGLHGEKLHNMTNPEMQRALFLTVNSKGQIITSDSAQHCVFIHSKEGTSLKRFGSRGRQPGQFDFPAAVAVGKEDSILVADTNNHRVQIFSRVGKFLRQLGPSVGGVELQAPRGLAADAAHIVVADSSGRLLIFTWDTRLVGVIGSEASPIREPYNLTLAQQRHVLVADFKNNCVKKYKYS